MSNSTLKKAYWSASQKLVNIKNQNVNLIRKTEGYIKNNSLKTHWFEEKKNFGDLITPLIIKANGFTPVNEKPVNANLISTGSILQLLPMSYSGTIIGSGIIKENNEIRFPNANILSVRGHLTRQCLGIKMGIPLGDPGLLASDFVNITDKRFTLGIIPHYVDQKNPIIDTLKSKYKEHLSVIDVKQNPTDVFNQISQCEHILSSSLHGIIVADSLDIPCAWVKLSDNVIGGSFKFLDYRSSFDDEITPNLLNGNESIKELTKLTSNVNFNKVEEVKADIRSTFMKYFKEIEA